jgi:ABC-type transporter Mla MlaB component
MAVHRVAVAFRVHGPIRRDDLPGLYRRICSVLEDSGASVALCDVHGVEADAVSAGALARLQLAARRRGCQIRLRGTSEQLRLLIEFMGLTEVLPEAPGSVEAGVPPESRRSVEAGGKPEQRQQPLRLEEERELGDPVPFQLDDL